ncbi:MAG: DNA gyrase inhibitor YacG [Pseudomonadota bacterium]|nr:DNA gyrase inhibitor YacG [Pseudomonadota bacterium]
MSKAAASSSSARTVRCPACGGPSVFAPENRWRPFCSERCKLHDLGAWASESFRVQASPAEDEGLDALPSDGVADAAR